MIGRGAFCVAVAGLMLFGPISAAGAHALLTEATPGDGAALTEAPSTITLHFTEEPDVDLSSIAVLDAQGSDHIAGPVSLGGDPRSLSADVGALGDGVYTVTWRVLSTVDGHLTGGAFAFGVNVSPSEIAQVDVGAEVTPAISVTETAGRVLFYVGLFLLIGGAVVGASIAPGAGASPVRLASSGIVVAAVGTGLLTVTQLDASGVDLGRFIESRIGQAIVWRGAALSLALLAVAASAVARARRGALGAAAVCGVAVLTVHASAGHAATGARTALRIAAQTTHATAGAVWIGGLAALLLAVRSLQNPERERSVRRYSRLAGYALAAVVFAGTARAVNEVGSLEGLVSTTYGRLVIAKVGALGVLVALGWRQRRRNVAASADDVSPLRRWGAAELGVAAAVLVLTGMLASSVPAATVLAARDESVVVAEGEDPAGAVTVRLELSPGTPGTNTFEVTADVRRGGAIEAVSLRLSAVDASVPEATLTLDRDGGVWTTSSADIAVPGRWRIVALVDRGADSVEVPLTLHTRCRSTVLDPSGDPVLHDVALGADRSLQAYADLAGRRTEVHFTFFDDSGDELPIEDGYRVIAVRDGTATELDVRRFSPGHIIAGGEFDDGAWTFTATVTPEGQAPLTVCFEEDL